VRWRLAAVIAVPTVTAAILGIIQINNDFNNNLAFGRVQTLVKLNSAVIKLTQSLEDERDASAEYAALRAGPESAALTGDIATTNTWVATVKADATGVGAGYNVNTVQDLTELLSSLNDLGNIRSAVQVPSKFPADQVMRVYTQNVIDKANAFTAQFGAGANDAQLQGSVTTLAALMRVENDVSQQRGMLGQALNTALPLLSPNDMTALQGEQSAESADTSEFTASTDQAQNGIFDNTVAGSPVDNAAEMETHAIQTALQSPNQPLTPNMGLDPVVWNRDMSEKIADTRKVAGGLLGQIDSRANALKSDATRSLLVTILITVLLLIVVVLVSTVVARSLTRPLRKLRSDALDVAGHRLPEIVRRLSQSEGADEGVEIEPIGVTSTDEIGEVARAFDQVHREAVRLAADEALLRGNLNAMFINLSRRSQSLIERQLSLIDSLEQSEQDPGRLSSLFRLDHLATRMRRNSENLLVLAGHEVARRWSQPIPLVDVLRAAISEIEQYERVVLNVQPGIVVVGQAVNDVVHLVAEIVENATTFSPEDTQVYVSGQPLSSGGVLLDITDNGVGISDQEMSHANWRLDNPPVVDVAVSRRMGLFVVGRLAARHGVRVRLRHAQAGGLTALIWLPETVAAPEVAPPLGRLRRFDEQDYGPAPSLSAPTPPAAASQATAAARIPRFSSSGPGGSAAFTSAADGPSSPGLPVRNGGGSGNLPGASVPGAAAPAPPVPAQQGDGAARPSRMPSFGGGQAPVRGGDGPGASGPTMPDPFADDQAVVLPEPPGSGDATELINVDRPVNGSGGTDGDINGSGSYGTVTIPPAAVHDQRLPIFDSLESDWFRRSGKTLSANRPAQPAAQSTWTSPADEGWKAAQAVAAPAAGETTDAGLPKRVPRANLVPGSVGGGQDGNGAGTATGPARTADDARSRMSSFQRGVREGRAAAPQIEEH
jgi:signal transduction histidine kinase